MKYRDFFKEDIQANVVADVVNTQDPNSQELQKGIKVEMEHTDDPEIAKKIAQDHLSEDPQYYSKLNKIGLENQINNTQSVVEPVVAQLSTGGETDVKPVTDQNATDVDSPSKDPQPTDHITGAIGSTPSNPNILQKDSGACCDKNPSMGGMQAVLPQDISIDIAEGKKILRRLRGDFKDTGLSQGKRWTVKM